MSEPLPDYLPCLPAPTTSLCKTAICAVLCVADGTHVNVLTFDMFMGYRS